MLRIFLPSVPFSVLACSFHSVICFPVDRGRLNFNNFYHQTMTIIFQGQYIGLPSSLGLQCQVGPIAREMKAVNCECLEEMKVISALSVSYYLWIFAEEVERALYWRTLPSQLDYEEDKRGSVLGWSPILPANNWLLEDRRDSGRAGSDGVHTLTGHQQDLGGNMEQLVSEGRFQKFMLGKLVDFSVKWVGGVLLVH